MQWVEGRNILQKTNATITYKFDWSQWLNGLTITAYNVSADSGLTVVSSQNDSQNVYISVSTPVLSVRKTLTCQITSSAQPYAQTDSRSVTIEGVSP